MATEIVGETKSLSLTFYILLLIVIVIVVLIIFFIKKLKCNIKQILKSIVISLLITIWVQILFLAISRFLPQPTCKIGGHCPTTADISLLFFPYTAPAIFLIVILIYYIIEFFRRK